MNQQAKLARDNLLTHRYNIQTQTDKQTKNLQARHARDKSEWSENPERTKGLRVEAFQLGGLKFLLDKILSKSRLFQLVIGFADHYLHCGQEDVDETDHNDGEVEKIPRILERELCVFGNSPFSRIIFISTKENLPPSDKLRHAATAPWQ